MITSAVIGPETNKNDLRSDRILDLYIIDS